MVLQNLFLIFAAKERKKRKERKEAKPQMDSDAHR
jgi:hypothetical protein